MVASCPASTPSLPWIRFARSSAKHSNRHTHNSAPLFVQLPDRLFGFSGCPIISELQPAWFVQTCPGPAAAPAPLTCPFLSDTEEAGHPAGPESSEPSRSVLVAVPPPRHHASSKPTVPPSLSPPKTRQQRGSSRPRAHGCPSPAREVHAMLHPGPSNLLIVPSMASVPGRDRPWAASVVLSVSWSLGLCCALARAVPTLW
jgi:hypothetical protein